MFVDDDAEGGLRWVRVAQSVQDEQDGPIARSCHKMVYNAKDESILLLGRYQEPDPKTNAIGEESQCILWRYSIPEGSWNVLFDGAHTKANDCSGPALIYDHTIALDEERQVLYVFGGRFTNRAECSGTEHGSGLYAYDLPLKKWRQLRADIPGKHPLNSPHPKSRIGHSMCWDPIDRTLIIYAGSHSKDILADLYVYAVDTDTVVWYCKDTTCLGGPPHGHTHRAVLIERDMYVFAGLQKDGHAGPEDKSPRSMHDGGDQINIYAWNLDTHLWRPIAVTSSSMPVNRYAHQICWMPPIKSPSSTIDDEDGKCGQVFYMFGGNPGHNNIRLDDFWRLDVKRTNTVEDLQRKALFALRKQQYAT